MSKKLHGLIDGDIILYECIAGKDDEILADLCYSIKKRLATLVEDCGVETYAIYLSGPREVNYRYDVYPAYKAKRPPKPAHIVGAKQYMYDTLGAIEGTVGENDDQLGREAYAAYADALDRWQEAGSPEGEERWYSTTVLMTTDKDLKMIPGWHYSWSPKSDHDWKWITKDEGFEWFFTQMLTGDSTDGIPGLKGVGPKAAEKVMAVSKTNLERLTNVTDKYVQKGVDLEYMLTMADLLWIQRDDRTGRDFLLESKSMGFDLEGAFPQPEPEPEVVSGGRVDSYFSGKSFAKKGTGTAAAAFAKKSEAWYSRQREVKVTGTGNGAEVVVTEGPSGTTTTVISPATSGKYATADAKQEQAHQDEQLEADLKVGLEGLANGDRYHGKEPEVSCYSDGTPVEFDDDIPF